MGLGPRLELRQSQQLVMTPQLQLAIKLLTLTNVELEGWIAEELERNPLLFWKGVSLILAPYGVPGQALGVVGVLGPTRMPYPRAVGSVQFVANLLSELVTRFHRA